MIIQNFNWLAVIISAVIYYLLGTIWFNPKVFGTMWRKGHNIPPPTDGEKESMGGLMATTAVLCIIVAIASGYFVYAINSLTWIQGVKVGLISGVGFTGVGNAINYLYIKKSIKLIFIDSAYHVTGTIICCIIMSVWR